MLEGGPVERSRKLQHWLILPSTMLLWGQLMIWGQLGALAGSPRAGRCRLLTTGWIMGQGAAGQPAGTDKLVNGLAVWPLPCHFRSIINYTNKYTTKRQTTIVNTPLKRTLSVLNRKWAFTAALACASRVLPGVFPTRSPLPGCTPLTPAMASFQVLLQRRVASSSCLPTAGLLCMNLAL